MDCPVKCSISFLLVNAREAKAFHDMNSLFRIYKVTPFIFFLHFIPVSGVVAATDPEIEADFYVSKDGSDEWSGTFSAPDSQGSDGPFASLEQARDAVRELKFTQSGSGAIRMDLHGMENTISGNHIEQMGGAGIVLCGYGPGTKDVNRKNLVYNNHIHHIGKIYIHSPGIFLWQSGENRVANNLIHHTPYCGMIVSGCMTHFFERADNRELVRTIRWHEVGGGPSSKTDALFCGYLP